MENNKGNRSKKDTIFLTVSIISFFIWMVGLILFIATLQLNNKPLTYTGLIIFLLGDLGLMVGMFYLIARAIKSYQTKMAKDEKMLKELREKKEKALETLKATEIELEDTKKRSEDINAD